MSSLDSIGVISGHADQPAPDDVRAHLARILASSAFRSSKRSQQFLLFVTEETLAGHQDRLKERTLAIEVFGRPPSWDASSDTIVRVGAREVRRRLAKYYASAEGVNDLIRIELSSGSYVPEFHLNRGETEPELPPPVAPQKHAERVSKQRWATWALLLFTVATVSIAVRKTLPKPTLFEHFWQPVWKSHEPVLIGIAHPLVYLPSRRAFLLNQQKVANRKTVVEEPLSLPPDALNGADFIPNVDQVVGFGDAVAASMATGLFTDHKKSSRLRLAGRIEFADLRESPTFLIGAFTNRWTMEFTQNLRYRFARDGDGQPQVVDSKIPGKTWKIKKSENGSSPEDYLIIARLSNSPTGNFLLIGGGLTQFGTEDAGRLLSNPDLLTEVLRRIGDHWQEKNLEMVLHTKVIGNSPGPPELVASHVW